MQDLNGKTVKAKYVGKGIKSGTVFNYTLYLSSGYVPDGSAAFVFTSDMLNTQQVKAMETLADEGKCPQFAALGVEPGIIPATTQDGFDRFMRRDEYDLASTDFADFIVDEMIPAVLSENGVVISEDANLHMVSGGSSGGIFAWNTVYYRNDFFRRAFAACPSFLAMSGGEDIPFLVKKLEPRPVRICVTLGEKEIDDYFGSGHPAGMMFRDALNYAGYDFMFDYFPGEAHGCRVCDYYSQLRFMDFMWKDYQSQPIKVPGLSPRIKNLIGDNAGWTETDEKIKFSDKTVLVTEKGTYKANKDTLSFVSKDKKSVTLGGFSNISGLALSSDLWRLYVTDTDKKYIFSLSVLPDGSPADIYKHTVLHSAVDMNKPGAYSLAVSSDDRIFLASDMGIQCSTSFGIVDIIFPLPENLPANGVELVGNTLYACCGDRVFSRKLNVGANDESVVTQPRHTEYFG